MCVKKYRVFDYDFVLKSSKIEALRDYFKLKNAKLANNLNLNDIQENMNDLIKNLDSLYTSDITESG